MRVLVINSGSSSIKFQLFKMPSADVVCSGMVERIGLDNAKIHYKTGETKIVSETSIEDHTMGLELIAQYLMDEKVGVITDVNEIETIGHRVVHGGDTFSETMEINEKVKSEIRSLFGLAPLHNPPNLEGIEVSERIFPNARQVAVFDTAFHQSIPDYAHRYAIPNEYYEKGIRVYGFHGTSHKYVSEKAIEFLGLQTSKIITIHLGNGCSISAVLNGKSIDHSLGFSPVSGLIMGTRSGDIDPAIVFYLAEKGMKLEDIQSMLQKESGMLGLTGYSDLRDIENAAEKGDQMCLLALQMNAYRVKKYIGAYVAAMNGLDAIVFTAGIGENSTKMRELICKDMRFLGLDLDENLNGNRSDEPREINKQNSNAKILVIPTNEELEIAHQCYGLIN